ncbi:MAG: hypothetical protein U1C71_03455, partial [archaeon]|nr:hypothetical protein [archaeon]
AWYVSQTESPISPPETIELRAGERHGPLLVQRIFPDRVEGLNFPDYPVSFEEGLPITLRVGEMASNGCTIFLTLEKINADSAEFSVTTRDMDQYPCPICLSGETVIETPGGAMNIKALQPGMAVWTLDDKGYRVEVPILRVSQTRVPLGHQMVRLEMEDGQVLYASPGHPLSDNRLIGEIRAGEIIEHTRIRSAERVPYGGSFTYDILPSGSSGTYWANDILVKSTLIKDGEK